MVKVVRVHETGGPEVLQIDDIELPPPGEGEVRIRNHAIGLNYIDVYFRNGQYPVAQKPFILGNEAAGEVVELAKGVKGFKRGDRVAYTVPFGCYAQERLVDAARLVKLPKAISYETAAAGLLKGLTAQYLLRHTFKVNRSKTCGTCSTLVAPFTANQTAPSPFSSWSMTAPKPFASTSSSARLPSTLSKSFKASNPETRSSSPICPPGMALSTAFACASRFILGGCSMSTTNGTLIKMQGVSKIFFTDELETHALASIDMEIKKGEYLAIAGPSGCGKARSRPR